MVHGVCLSHPTNLPNLPVHAWISQEAGGESQGSQMGRYVRERERESEG